MQKIKRILKIGGIAIGGIFVLLLVIGFTIGSQPSNTAPTQPTAASSNEVQSASVNDATATTTIGQPQAGISPATAAAEPDQQGQTQATTPAPSQSSQSTSQCAIRNYLPDPNCTPGATDPRVTQQNIQSTICVSGYTATVRPSTSVTNPIKTAQMQAYGDTDSPSDYELDHFIPLEIGGAPASVLNLFPEPYAEPYGAHDKDQVENYLHKQICNGAMTLAAAQEAIRTNWVAVYNNCCSTGTTQSTAPAAATTTQSSSHTFYLSTYNTSRYYYCDTDPGWKSLSSKYLKSYPSEAALLADYPDQILHAPCQ